MEATLLTPPVRRRSSMRQRRARTLRVLGMLLVVLFTFILAPRAVEMMAHTESPVTVTHTVASGDTLWDIAGHYSDGDVREAIYAIRKANQLETGTVYPGQVLVIPESARR